MRSFVHRVAFGLAAIAEMSKTPIAELAGKFSQSEALRVASRLERRGNTTLAGMSLAQLVAQSARWARARQTHPHKRSR